MSDHLAAHDLPVRPVAATFRQVDGRWTLTLERSFPQPIDQVWAAITDSSQVRRWAPFAPDRDLTSPGAVRLTQLGRDTSTVNEAQVLQAVAPTSLVFTWGTDELRLELTPTATGTRLVLSQVFVDRPQASLYGAGWHLCLGALELGLAGRPVPAVVGDAAGDFGWDALEVEYRAALAAG